MITLPIPHFYVDKVWSRVGKILQPAVDLQDGYRLEDVKAEIKHRNWQLWVGADSDDEVLVVAVTRIEIYPRKKACVICFLAGTEMPKWKHLLGDIEDWAVQNGCTELEIQGRKGWVREMKDFTHTDVVCYKKIGGDHV